MKESKQKLLATVSVVQGGLTLQLLQQALGPSERLGAGQRPAQVVHQHVETRVVGGLLKVFRTLVQPGTQDGGQGTVERQRGKTRVFEKCSSIWKCRWLRKKGNSPSDGAVGFRAFAFSCVLLGSLRAAVPAAEKKNSKPLKKKRVGPDAPSRRLTAAPPVEQQLQDGLRAGEGSVGGQEDGGVGEVVVSGRRQQRLHQTLQCSGADASDFAGLQLAHRVAGRQAIPLRLNTHTSSRR